MSPSVWLHSPSTGRNKADFLSQNPFKMILIIRSQVSAVGLYGFSFYSWVSVDLKQMVSITNKPWFVNLFYLKKNLKRHFRITVSFFLNCCFSHTISTYNPALQQFSWLLNGSKMMIKLLIKWRNAFLYPQGKQKSNP